MSLALVDRLRSLPAAERAAILSRATPEQLAALKFCWPFWQRPDMRTPGALEGFGQTAPPPPWTWWANIGGRSSGKTRAAAEWVNAEAKRLGRGCIFHFLGATIEDARATMVEGISGILAIAPPGTFAPDAWRPSVMGGTLHWKSGARARCFGADKAAKGRGPACNRFWIDDPAAFGPHGQEVLEQLLFGFRERAPDGGPPRGVISSTPIDSDILRWILSGADGKRRSRMVFSRSITDDNRGNVSEEWLNETLAEFAGTELEQQERFGRLDLSGSGRIFREVDFTAAHIAIPAAPPTLRSLAVWIDTASADGIKACEVGIVAVGQTPDGRAVVLEDASGHYNAHQWPYVAHECLERWARFSNEAHFGVETNHKDGNAVALLAMAERERRSKRGEQAINTIRIIPIHTSKTKAERASLLVASYKAGDIKHVRGLLVLETQLKNLSDSRTGTVGKDRADACVYGLLDVFGILDKVRPGAMMATGSGFVGAFGGGAMGAINVGTPAPGGMAFQMPGVPMAGAFGRSPF